MLRLATKRNPHWSVFVLHNLKFPLDVCMLWLKQQNCRFPEQHQQCEMEETTLWSGLSEKNDTTNTRETGPDSDNSGLQGREKWMTTTWWADEQRSEEWVITVKSHTQAAVHSRRTDEETQRGARGHNRWIGEASLAQRGRWGVLQTTRGATEEGEERGEDGDEGQEVLRESVYRLWFINSRAVSKSSRSSESLWIGAKKMHLLKSPHPPVQKARLINDFK